MNRSVITLAALVALSLSGCSSTDDESPEKVAPAGSDSAANADAERFQTLWSDAEVLFAESSGGSTDVATRNEELGLDESSPLRYTDMSGDEGGGRWCLSSDAGTWLAMVYGSGDSQVLMGDGECSYDEADAEVTGDQIAGTWAKGAGLMGDTKLEFDPDAAN